MTDPKPTGLYVDFRMAIPFVLPFVLLGLLRLLWWAAGAAWTEPDIAAIVSGFLGLTMGALLSGLLFEGKHRIGGFWIGRRQ